MRGRRSPQGSPRTTRGAAEGAARVRERILVAFSTKAKRAGIRAVVMGELASELVHVGQGCLHFGGTLDYFIETVFNYPSLADAYKYAAYDGLGNLARLKQRSSGLGDQASERT